MLPLKCYKYLLLNLLHSYQICRPSTSNSCHRLATFYLQLDALPLQIRRVGYFQQDDAPPHYALTVRAYLDHTFPGRWIDRAGHCAGLHNSQT